MSAEHQQILAGIAGLEAQRALLGDSVVDASIAALRAKLIELTTASSAEPAQTLRQVSILFLDMVGSTTLSQFLDPEDIHVVMDGALARCTSVVLAHHGKVLQYAGDNLLAVFGATEVMEDDVERAVRCGLALLAEGRALGAEVQTSHGHAGFDVRVGIHTGGVLLGGGVDGEHSIRGIAVNIAARMEQAAPAGGLRISHDTYAQVRGVFTVQAEPPLQVKGLVEPVATYLVLGEKPRVFRVPWRGIEGIQTRMIGRDAEFERLKAAFQTLMAGSTFATVTVVAEAGMGKSRLLHEFRNWADARPERFKVFQGRATPQAQRQPYGLLRDVLAWQLQIADSDSMEATKAKLEQGIAPLFMADDGAEMAQAHAHLLGHLVGIDFTDSVHVRGVADDARQIRNRGFHAAAQMFRHAAMQGGLPLILYLDDLHWADDGSLDFLDHLAQENRNLPMLILGFTRPALFERRPKWPSTGGIHQRIELASLDKRHSSDLAGELLKKLPEVPVELRELLTGSGGGNPFYMEELVKMLIDQKTIQTGPEHWVLHPEKLLATEVPPTLTGVLQARLDGLPPQEKLALQQASVVGLVFWDAALVALDRRAPEALPSLVHRELVLPRKGAVLEGLREYSFRHQILHEVTYGTLLRRTRRELHAKAAAWLSAQAGARSGDFLAATAEHYERAGDIAHACEYHARAAEHAKSRFAHNAALDHVSRALALADKRVRSPQDEGHAEKLLRWRLLDVRERSLELLGRRAEQREDLDALERLAEVLDDDHKRAELAVRRSHLAMRMGDYATQALLARRAMTVAHSARDAEPRLRAQRLLSLALANLTQVPDAERLANDGLAEARNLGLHRVEVQYLNAQAIIAGIEDDWVAALEWSKQYLELETALSNRTGQALALGNLGAGWLMIGDNVQALRYLKEGLRLNGAVGNRALQPNVLCYLSLLALRQGDAVQAMVHARSALEIAESVQAQDMQVYALVRIGNAQMALGRYAASAAALERAQSLAVSLGNAYQHEAAAGLARVALALGDMVDAVRHVQGLLDHLANGGTFEGADQPRLIQLTCYQVLARAKDARAAGLLEQAHAELQRKARAISDALLRQGFMENIPEHHEIVATWAALHALRAADQA